MQLSERTSITGWRFSNGDGRVAEGSEIVLWLIAIELILFCALFTLMVKIAVGNNALNGLYFYLKPVQEKAFAVGLTDRDT